MNIQNRSRAPGRGQALVESAILIGFISIGVILALFVIGDGLQSFLARIGTTLARH